MKRKMMVSLVSALVMIFGLYGVAFSGGGGFEDPVCQNLPQPSSGPFLYGIFTVARDKSSCSIDSPTACGHYDVQAVLFRETKIHLFSFPSSLGVGDLCDSGIYNKWIKTEFACYPCMLEVGKAFGIKGTPVITKVSIIKKGFCGTPDEMIYGYVIIRIVPF